MTRLGPVLFALALFFLANGSAQGRVQQAETPSSAFETAIGEARSAMMRDPAQALELSAQAEALIGDNVPAEVRNESLATVNWLQAEALTRLGRPNEAQPVAERALELLGEEPRYTKLYADILTSLGRTLKLTGEHGLALDMFQSAFEVYASIGEARSQAIVLQSIGSIYNDARQYERAIEYFQDSTARFQDNNLDLAAFNNLGNAYTALGDVEAALEHFRRARDIAREMDSPMLQARILNNIASLHIADGNWTAADASIDTAFELAGDPQGAEWARFLYGVRAQAAYGRGNYTAARTHLERVFEGVPLEETNHHFMDFHETAARTYAALGDFATAMHHFEAFKRLDDDGRDFAASANAALVGAQFDFAAQELQIEQLRAEGLERDLALIRSEARQRMVIATGIGASLLMLIIGAIFAIGNLRERHRIAQNLLNVDAETGLPTRHALVQNRNRLIAAGDRPTFIVIFDVARGSHIENMLGFERFVRIQQKLGERLEDMQGLSHVSIVGPGEFGAILDTDDSMIIEDELPGILREFCQPISLDGVDVDIDAVIGLDKDADSELAVRNAMIATSQAKERLDPYAIYNARRFGDPADTLSRMTRMSEAMQSGAMELHFQPKFDLRAGRFTSAEALCRWIDKDAGPVSPDTFIPQAEQTGRIRELTEWTIGTALASKRALAKSGFDLDIAINISGRLVADEKFGRKALALLGHGVSGITFEITETAIMHHPEAAMRNLDLWVDAGIRLAIDDYGAGFSSLAYLKRLPCHELKMDKMFVDDAKTSVKDRTLIKSTIDLAHNLGLRVTAEGVEDTETVGALQVMGCDFIQGYVFSKALPVEGLIDFLRQSVDTPVPETRHARPAN